MMNKFKTKKNKIMKVFLIIVTIVSIAAVTTLGIGVFNLMYGIFRYPAQKIENYIDHVEDVRYYESLKKKRDSLILIREIDSLENLMSI